jgi:hypothetical protein
MELDKPEIVARRQANILVHDRTGRTFMVLALRARPATAKALAQLIVHLKSLKRPGSFAMLVDPDEILILQSDSQNAATRVCSLNTTEVLSHYDADFATQRLYRDFLETLVVVWLRDFSNHWKYEKPPGSHKLALIGLLPELQEARIQTAIIVLGGMDN